MKGRGSQGGVKRVLMMNLHEHDVCKEDPFAS